MAARAQRLRMEILQAFLPNLNSDFNSERKCLREQCDYAHVFYPYESNNKKKCIDLREAK